MLKAAGMEHHMMILTICQGGVIETGGAKSSISLLVTKSHWRHRGETSEKQESEKK